MMTLAIYVILDGHNTIQTSDRLCASDIKYLSHFFLPQQLGTNSFWLSEVC